MFKPPQPQSNHALDKHMLGMFRYGRRAIGLVWQTSPSLTVGLALATLVAGLLPAGAAYVGQLIVDSVLAAMATYQETAVFAFQEPLLFVLIESVIVLAISGAQRAISAQQSLLRALLGQKVNTLILEKAQTLSLSHFEDSEFYDKLIRARREASSRPLALVNKTFTLLQNAIALTSFSILLWQFSPWALVILIIGALPAFIAEAKFSGDAFRLFRWRSPETRTQNYLETLLAREDNIKEVKLYQLGAIFLARYKAIFHTLYGEDKHLTLRRETWGFLLGIISTLVFYGAYLWIISDTIMGLVTLGQMTMYLLLFKQGQAAVTSSLSSISGMYEDNLYVSNLYDYLEQEVEAPVTGLMEGPIKGDGIRFENVSFRYPGATNDALSQINLHIKPGQSLAIVGENGSGKTTLIKLLTRLYLPSTGQILLDGLALPQWQEAALLNRIGVIFQDFVRYQLIVGENIGAGDQHHFNTEEHWQRAAKMGMATDFIESMEKQYHTQLGRWFKDGQELSGGQWQKIALARAFMRPETDILVLDEPTAAMDAQAEANIFEHFQEHTKDKMAILISHRFSTVRIASQILVMDKGKVLEQGDHATLISQQGVYARLFNLQAKGYK